MQAFLKSSSFLARCIQLTSVIDVESRVYMRLLWRFMEDEVKHLSVDIESNMKERSGGEKWVKFTSEQNIFYETKKILLLIDCNE